jgi:copper chaperone CopZ
MLTRRTALLAALACLSAATAQAASPVPYTTIQVHNMHCQECAKTIARKLYAVPGVVEVRADVPKNIAYVVPQQGKTLPPRQLWEAVEASGFKVARLSGPSGTFSAKPR